jgi:hypothetical protein
LTQNRGPLRDAIFRFANPMTRPREKQRDRTCFRNIARKIVSPGAAHRASRKIKPSKRENCPEGWGHNRRYRFLHRAPGSVGPRPGIPSPWSRIPSRERDPAGPDTACSRPDRPGIEPGHSQAAKSLVPPAAPGRNPPAAPALTRSSSPTPDRESGMGDSGMERAPHGGTPRGEVGPRRTRWRQRRRHGAENRPAGRMSGREVWIRRGLPD